MILPKSELIWTPSETLIRLDASVPTVTVLNCWAAEKYSEPVPVISFNEWNGPGIDRRHEYPLGTHHEDVLRIYCDDVTEQLDESYRVFDYIDGLKILRFLDKHCGNDIMAHCAAGVSRSPAVAKFMCDYLGYRLSDLNAGITDFFKCHNTHVYYTLKRVMLDHTSLVDNIKRGSYDKEKEV